MNAGTLQFNMTQQQIRTWEVYDDNILELMETVPRDIFVPEDYKQLAYSDIEIPILKEQVMLQPKVVARMLQDANAFDASEALEIGTGTGYITALLANICSNVNCIEYYPELNDIAIGNFEKLRLHNINDSVGDLFESLQTIKTYDLIIASGAFHKIPEFLPKLLNTGGRLVTIEGSMPIMQAKLITQISQNEFEQKVLFETVAPYFINAPQDKKFEF